MALLRKALEAALPYVRLHDHEGRDEDEMREAYPEAAKELDELVGRIQAALAKNPRRTTKPTRSAR